MLGNCALNSATCDIKRALFSCDTEHAASDISRGSYRTKNDTSPRQEYMQLILINCIDIRKIPDKTQVRSDEHI